MPVRFTYTNAMVFHRWTKDLLKFKMVLYPSPFSISKSCYSRHDFGHAGLHALLRSPCLRTRLGICLLHSRWTVSLVVSLWGGARDTARAVLWRAFCWLLVSMLRICPVLTVSNEDSRNRLNTSLVLWIYFFFMLFSALVAMYICQY